MVEIKDVGDFIFLFKLYLTFFPFFVIYGAAMTFLL